MTELARVEVNGESREIAPGVALLDFLRECGLPAHGLLIEYNGTALLRAEWDGAHLAAGDRLEILRVAAGG